jgi:hypothetical protein
LALSLKKALLVAYLESSGMPSLYLPVSWEDQEGNELATRARELEEEGKEVHQSGLERRPDGGSVAVSRAKFNERTNGER